MNTFASQRLARCIVEAVHVCLQRSDAVLRRLKLRRLRVAEEQSMVSATNRRRQIYVDRGGPGGRDDASDRVHDLCKKSKKEFPLKIN